MPKERAPRKARVDSKESAVLAMIHAHKIIDPPSDLAMNKDQVTIFAEIIGEFAKVDWSKHSIRLAAYLARAMWGLQEAQEQLFGTSGTPDFTSVNERGTVTADPLVSVCQNLAGQILSMRRSLALHAVAGGVKKGDIGNRRSINKGSEDDAPSDDLIALPGRA